MNTRLAQILPHLETLRAALHRRQDDQPTYPPFRLDDDLTDMTGDDLVREIDAVEKRLNEGYVEPEGEDGLKYRLHRLKAQQRVVGKKAR